MIFIVSAVPLLLLTKAATLKYLSSNTLGDWYNLCVSFTLVTPAATSIFNAYDGLVCTNAASTIKSWVSLIVPVPAQLNDHPGAICIEPVVETFIVKNVWPESGTKSTIENSGLVNKFCELSNTSAGLELCVKLGGHAALVNCKTEPCVFGTPLHTRIQYN